MLKKFFKEVFGFLHYLWYEQNPPTRVPENLSEKEKEKRFMKSLDVLLDRGDIDVNTYVNMVYFYNRANAEKKEKVCR